MGRARIDITGKILHDGVYSVIEKSLEVDQYAHPKWKVKCHRSHLFTAYSDLIRRTKLCPECREIESKLAPVRDLMQAYRRNAHKRGLVFDLDFIDFDLLISLNCGYCGIAPSQVLKKKDAKYGVTYNGIDSIDNAVGYVKNNCLSCCRPCNYAKYQLSYDDFMLWVQRITDFRNAQPLIVPNADGSLSKFRRVITWGQYE